LIVYRFAVGSALVMAGGYAVGCAHIVRCSLELATFQRSSSRA